ncbi:MULTISPECIES: helix-turn-helix transcriptional regulator [Leptospira]|uniref:DNA-binding helix-turn-helix protein n=1 Tax=Leptospira weilii str. 2006001853 TaxID=1001589 RepID=A0A828Z198_9LEPT|nr:MULTISPECIES: helix-turn-helix transcriptional regulator [Leptospira]EKR64995.1 DNA-binding helix-turn-helix protein [Leptospira weilii str. 2006001853]MCL8268652.1 helix-turn-helix transcriptional regulator [Leptospira weilii]MDL5247512.1 helix-turn-helix transcriptional regulator [Leptospira weilii]QDK25257.1 helix-turn-helix transcriptional regulator [Leptospira weilii]QDK29159.1 helix-turn-helix transcriptional regulator [Leptospira weilii]
MLVVVKTPRIDLRIKGKVSEKLLGAIREEFGKRVEVQDEDDVSVPFRESEFWKKYGHLATPGSHMKTYREMAGWSQSELGQKLGGIGRSHISEYESGKRPIGKDLAKKLAKLFKTSPAMFI